MNTPVALDVGPAEVAADQLCCQVTACVPLVIDGRLCTATASWLQPCAADHVDDWWWGETLEVQPEPDPQYWYSERCDVTVWAFRLAITSAWNELAERLHEEAKAYRDEGGTPVVGAA